MTSKIIARQLGNSGLCICPGFLSPRSLSRAADDLDGLRTKGLFHQAGFGRGVSVDSNVRNDETYWLDPALKTGAQNRLWRKLDLLRWTFNRTLFLGLTEFEGHYAVYPEGGHYERHKDCFRGNSDRVVSFVLYLNRNWQSADGGRLRLFSSAAIGQESHLDVDPVGGTMVCFMSNEAEHEVLLSHQLRFSLTGWFKRARLKPGQ